MDTTYHEIISMFVDKHGLSRGQVIAEIERTFSSMLSRWHRKNVVVMFSEGKLTALGYHDGPTGPDQVEIELTTMRGWNSIKRILDQNLGKASCMDEVAKYKCRERQMLWGEIVSKNTDSLGVELNLDFCEPIIADCPLKYIGPHERDQLQVGEKRAFHLRQVEAVLLGGTPRTKITLDRVSKTLPKTLLQDLLGDLQIKVHCQKRYVGKKSFVYASNFLPKKVIKAASRELGEHIQVKVVRDKR